MASGGYDYEFVPELLDEFICVICHLALRKPNKLVECGHQFCESCLNHMRDHANPGNEMLCPIDRNTFTQGQIFHDKGTERSIMKWKVKCPKYEDGCEWIGELNDVEAHKRKCKFHLKTYDDDAVNGRLNKRIETLESALAQKSAELLSLKETVTELELKITLRDEQFQQLSKEFKQFKVDQSSMKETLKKCVQSDDPLTLEIFGNKVVWKCPYFVEKDDVGHSSPCFYHQNYCFQFSFSYTFNGGILCLNLYRCRGKFDDNVAAITNQLPPGFLFTIGIFNKNGIAEKFDYERRQMDISQNFNRSAGYNVCSLTYQNYVTNGFYHVEGEFMLKSHLLAHLFHGM